MSTKRETKNKNFIFNRSVLFEKSCDKNFIFNSEKYLNSLGIGIYILIESKMTSYAEYKSTYGSISNKTNLEHVIKKYDSKILRNLYETLTTNVYLQDLPNLDFDLAHFGKEAYLAPDGHHSNFLGNAFQSIFGFEENLIFKIYCMNSKIIKKAGYSEHPYPNF